MDGCNIQITHTIFQNNAYKVLQISEPNSSGPVLHWCPILDTFSRHTQGSCDKLLIHHNPDQGKELTVNE